MEGLHDHGQLTGIAVVALAALACGMLLTRLRQPAIVGYIVAGVLLGPSALGLVQDRAIIQLLAEMGVLLLLFLIGMELSLRAFRDVAGIAILTTLAQIVLGIASMFALSTLLDWSWELSIVMGFVVALSSTAVAVKMLEEIGELRTRVGQVTVGVLIAQDLAVVPMMLTVSALGAVQRGGTDGEEIAALGWTAVGNIAFSVGFLVFLILWLSRRERLHLPFAKLVGNHVDLTPLAGLAFCFGAAAASGLLGLSPAYGAFLAGLVIGNSTGRKVMLRHTQPVQSILLMVFFLSVGLLLDLRFLWDNLGSVLALLFFIFVLKTLLNIGALRLFGETWPRAFMSGVVLGQIGEFSFVLAALGLTAGVVSFDAHRLIVALTVLSLILAPFYLVVARRTHRALLLGITSGRETVRLAFGNEAAAVARSAGRAEDMMVTMATGATRWVGDLMPSSSRRSAGPPGDTPRPKRRH
jgi:CPA2 family monovalent cation:H+ antiporter-2